MGLFLITTGGVAAILTLIGYAFVLIQRASGYFDFSLCGLMSVAAYVAFAVSSHVPLVIAVSIGSLAGAIVAAALHAALFVRIRQLPPAGLFVVSLGLATVIINLLSLVFGDATLALAEPGGWLVGPVHMPKAHGLAMAAVAGVLLLRFLIRRHPWVLQLRALIDDRQLAREGGLPIEPLTRVAHGVAGAFAGAAGNLLAVNSAIDPTLGLRFAGFGMAIMLAGAHRFTSVLAIAAVVSVLRVLVGRVAGPAWEDSLTLLLIVAWSIAAAHGAGSLARRSFRL